MQLDAEDIAFIDGKRISLASIPARVQAMRAQSPDAVISIRAKAKTSVDAVVFVKDRMDGARIPVTIKVED